MEDADRECVLLQQMCLLLRESLSIGKLHFSNEFFSTTACVREVKQQLEGELRNFCVLVEAAKTPFGKGAFLSRRATRLQVSNILLLLLAVKKTYSGKVGGRNDDLVITLQLALTGSRVFYTECRYRSFRPVRFLLNLLLLPRQPLRNFMTSTACAVCRAQVNNEHVPIPT